MLIEKVVTDDLGSARIDSELLTPLITSIGTPKFVNTLMTFGQAACGANFVSVFCLGDRDTPLLVGTASTVGYQRAKLAASGYEHHFRDDRNATLLSSPETIGDFLTVQTAQSVASFPYRRDCYERPGIADRVSLVRRRADYGLVVSLYRAEEIGPFLQGDYNGIAAILGVMLAAAERHVAYTLKGMVWRSNDIQIRLALIYPDLTEREREVAAMTIKGRTAIQIAEILGLAETTIITHRKKAYRRMNVANLRELIARYNGTSTTGTFAEELPGEDIG